MTPSTSSYPGTSPQREYGNSIKDAHHENLGSLQITVLCQQLSSDQSLLSVQTSSQTLIQFIQYDNQAYPLVT